MIFFSSLTDKKIQLIEVVSIIASALSLLFLFGHRGAPFEGGATRKKPRCLEEQRHKQMHT